MKNMNTLLFAALLAVAMGCKKKEQPDQASSLNKQLSEAKAFGSPEGDVVGKITVGYQGWFATQGDNSPMNIWWHWAPNAFQIPSTSNIGIKSWPDVRDYTTTYQTGFANLNNGQQARLFSSFDDQTINTQFQWMQQYGIDVAALQRFNPTGGEGPIRDAITVKVRKAAEATGRKFYIMYDVSGWTNMQSEIKADWTNKMSVYTSSSAYARQNGKPVVCIWGFGFSDNNHPWSAATCLDVINWFKSQGCYVIGGVPTHWRDENSDSRAGFLNTYKAFNMLSPWMVGRIGNIGDVDNFYNNVNLPDQAYCNANGIDYQPCILPGDLQERQRAHGDFMWRQFYNMKRVGVQGIYISMFDEYNEGNQIAKTAENASFIPAGSNFLTLDEDGVACSSDYYLRLTGDGGKMFKGQIPLTAVRPTEPIVGHGNGGTSIPVGQTITIKSSDNKYISSENNLAPMNANRPSAGGWEQFTVVDAGNGKVALRNQNKYVTSENGSLAISCNRPSIGPWEQFEWINNPDGTVSFKGSNGKFISSEGGTQAMTCNRPSAGIWESFRINQ